MRIASSLFLVFAVALILASAGAILAWRQQSMLANAHPVPAKVIASQSSGMGQVFIRYEYQDRFTTVSSNRLTPLPVVAPWLDAADVLAAYPPKQKVEAYISAGSRGAYLLRRAQAYPFLLIWSAAALVLLTLGVLGRSGLLCPSPCPMTVAGSDWCVLSRWLSVQQVVTWRLVEAMSWYVISALFAGAYLFSAPQPYDWSIALAAVGLVIGIVPLVRVWRWSNLAMAMGEPVITIMRSPLNLDVPVRVHLGLAVRRPIAVRELRVALVCDQRHGWTAQNLFLTSAIAAEQQQLIPQQPLSVECELQVPHKKRRPSSGVEDRFEFPRIDWQIELHVQPMKGSSFVVRLPVEVRLAGEEQVTAEAA
ncbi:MAG: hypothetical protein IT445_15460 [Phycisphaeraceae bacterium]|nr:hypothetical protein [Phycisphaeraceae bacterium]